jgi:hypothetical protein
LITPLYIPSSDIYTICATDPDNPLCDIDPSGYSGGVLLYGNGRPVARSPLYLGFIENADLREGARFGAPFHGIYGRPLIHYYIHHDDNGGWTYLEEHASPLPSTYWQNNSNPCHHPGQMYEGLNLWTVEIEDALQDMGYYSGELPSSPSHPQYGQKQNEFEMALNDAISDLYSTVMYGQDPWEWWEANGWVNYLLGFKFYRRYDNCSQLMDGENGLDEPAFHFSPETCLPLPHDQKRMFRPLSAIIVREPANQPPRILLIGRQHQFLTEPATTTYKWAWLSSPWDIQDGGDLNEPLYVPGVGTWNNDVEGYGTYIINGSGDKYLNYSSQKGVLTFWMTVSSWEGPGSFTPYGTFSKEIKIEWPPQ